MSERITAVLDQIEAEQQGQPLPEGIGALPLLQMAYRGQVQLTPQQMRAAIEALPFEAPKLSATARIDALAGQVNQASASPSRGQDARRDGFDPLIRCGRRAPTLVWSARLSAGT